MRGSKVVTRQFGRPAVSRLGLEQLEGRDVPAGSGGLTALGADAGGAPVVKVFLQDQLVASFLAFEAGFTGGVRVAVGDINGDGFDDLVAAAGPGAGPRVVVYAGVGQKEVIPPSPFNPGGGPGLLFTQTGIDTSAPVASFFAYDESFTGGVVFAVANVDPSNDFLIPRSSVGAALLPGGYGVRNEIITAPASNGGPNVKVFSNTADFTLPAALAVVNLDPMTGLPTSPTVAQLQAGVDAALGLNPGFLVDGNNPLSSVFVFEPTFRGGVTLAAGNVNSSDDFNFGQYDNGQRLVQTDLFPDIDLLPDLIIGAGEGGAPRVVVLKNLSTQDGATGAVTFNPFLAEETLADFFAFEDTLRGGVSVAVGDQNGDGLPDIIAGAGVGGAPVVRVFAAQSAQLTTLPTPPWSVSPPDPTTGAQTGFLPVANPLPDDPNAPIPVSTTNLFASITTTQFSADRPLLSFAGIDTATPYASFLAGPETFTGGVRVAAAGSRFYGGVFGGGGGGLAGTILVTYGPGLAGVATEFTNAPLFTPFVPTPTAPGPLPRNLAPNTYSQTTSLVFDPGFTGGLFAARSGITFNGPFVA